MDLGTWGKWFGAGATTVATVAALYFGTRDQALPEDRSAARLAIRWLDRGVLTPREFCRVLCLNKLSPAEIPLLRAAL